MFELIEGNIFKIGLTNNLYQGTDDAELQRNVEIAHSPPTGDGYVIYYHGTNDTLVVSHGILNSTSTEIKTTGGSSNYRPGSIDDSGSSSYRGWPLANIGYPKFAGIEVQDNGELMFFYQHDFYSPKIEMWREKATAGLNLSYHVVIGSHTNTASTAIYMLPFTNSLPVAEVQINGKQSKNLIKDITLEDQLAKDYLKHGVIEKLTNNRYHDWDNDYDLARKYIYQQPKIGNILDYDETRVETYDGTNLKFDNNPYAKFINILDRKHAFRSFDASGIPSFYFKMHLELNETTDVSGIVLQLMNKDNALDEGYDIKTSLHAYPDLTTAPTEYNIPCNNVKNCTDIDLYFSNKFLNPDLVSTISTGFSKNINADISGNAVQFNTPLKNDNTVRYYNNSNVDHWNIFWSSKEVTKTGITLDLSSVSSQNYHIALHPIDEEFAEIGNNSSTQDSNNYSYLYGKYILQVEDKLRLMISVTGKEVDKSDTTNRYYGADDNSNWDLVNFDSDDGHNWNGTSDRVGDSITWTEITQNDSDSNISKSDIPTKLNFPSGATADNITQIGCDILTNGNLFWFCKINNEDKKYEIYTIPEKQNKLYYTAFGARYNNNDSSFDKNIKLHIHNPLRFNNITTGSYMDTIKEPSNPFVIDDDSYQISNLTVNIKNNIVNLTNTTFGDKDKFFVTNNKTKSGFMCKLSNRDDQVWVGLTKSLPTNLYTTPGDKIGKYFIEIRSYPGQRIEVGNNIDENTEMKYDVTHSHKHIGDGISKFTDLTSINNDTALNITNKQYKYMKTYGSSSQDTYFEKGTLFGMDILPDGYISAYYIFQGEKVELCKIPETPGNEYHIWMCCFQTSVNGITIIENTNLKEAIRQGYYDNCGPTRTWVQPINLRGVQLWKRNKFSYNSDSDTPSHTHDVINGARWWSKETTQDGIIASINNNNSPLQIKSNYSFGITRLIRPSTSVHFLGEWGFHKLSSYPHESYDKKQSSSGDLFSIRGPKIYGDIQISPEIKHNDNTVLSIPSINANIDNIEVPVKASFSQWGLTDWDKKLCYVCNHTSIHNLWVFATIYYAAYGSSENSNNCGIAMTGYYLEKNKTLTFVDSRFKFRPKTPNGGLASLHGGWRYIFGVKLQVMQFLHQDGMLYMMNGMVEMLSGLMQMYLNGGMLS